MNRNRVEIDRRGARLRNHLPIFLLLVLSASMTSAAQPQRPNILILLTDDQRWDAMACAGNTIAQTPEMDRLAREGTMFSNGFVTTSICAASRASIFTGQYERTHGCNFNTGIPSREQLEMSYPMLLRRAGYHTGFIGKYGIDDAFPHEIEGNEVNNLAGRDAHTKRLASLRRRCDQLRDDAVALRHRE
ncbi:MAG: sulfatase-like hydrolase/transferase [Fuerstiella sp.]|nr:sulfatase-like hydrolase/transferase [Fuerstiella sp.]MCP4856267.1 sulfatase-like hydrolase/transferase [Fuerstiella sp.]